MNHPSSTLDRYRALMSELLFSRAAEGGDLPLQVESAYVEQLDGLWWQLSEEEQAAFETELAADSSPTGPTALELVDCTIRVGERAAPRKAA